MLLLAGRALMAAAVGVSWVCMALFVLVTRHKRTLHVNLWLVLLKMELGVLAALLGQFLSYVLLPDRGSALFYVGSTLIFLGFYSVTSDFLFMSLERLTASIQLSTYENSQHVRTFFLVSVFSWALFAYVTYVQVFGSRRLNNLLIQLTSLFIATVLLLSFVLLCSILRWNKKRYEVAIRSRKSYTLSQRFQLAEIIKMTEGIRLGIQIFVVIGCVSAGFYATAYGYRSWIDSKIFYAIRAVVLSVIDIGFIFSFYAMMNANPLWRSDIDAMLSKVSSSLRSTRSEEQIRPMVHNLKGQQILMEVSEEGDFHFKQLQESWK